MIKTRRTFVDSGQQMDNVVVIYRTCCSLHAIVWAAQHDLNGG